MYVIDEPDRRGFAYGTLRGHPESGEVLFTVRAFTRPGALLARATGPAGRVAQWLVAGWYLRGMRRLVSSPAHT